MDQKKPQTKPKQTAREKRLNVVYFVDSARTRSFSLSLGKLNLLLALGGMFVVWAFVATGFVYYLINATVEHRVRYRTALSTIFDYQSRYDGVYELAYPEGQRIATTKSESATKTDLADDDENDLADSDFADATSEPRPGANAPERKQIAAPTVQASANESKEALAPATTDASDSGTKSPAEWLIDLERPSVEKRPQGFDLNFALRNLQKDSKADGYVWAVATVLRDSGEAVHFSAPMNLPLDHDGNVADGRRAHKFSIRHYKAKKFSFLTPDGVTGTLTNISVGLLNQDGASKVFKVPVKVKIDKPVPPRPGAEKEVSPAPETPAPDPSDPQGV
jgi:hypothetical protein